MIPVFATALSGGLCILAFPGSPLPALAWICFAPWLASLPNAAPWAGAVSGLIVGVLYAVPCTVDGIYTAAQGLSNDPAAAGLLTLLFYLPYFIPFMVTGWYAAVSGLSGIRRALGGSAVWTAATFAVPSLFPVTPGLMLHEFPAAIQLADIGGVPLVNFVLFLVNFLLAGILRSLSEKKSIRRETAYLALSVAIVAGYGYLRLATFQPDATARSLHVALIQPNLPQGVNEIGLIRDNRTQVISALEMTRRLLKTQRIDLAVFPETGVPASCAESGLVFRKLSAVAQETGVSFLYQCLDCQEKVCFNAARMVFPRDKSPELYRKRALIPFLETVPESGFYAWLTDIVPVPGRFKSGSEKRIYSLPQGIRAMPLICYDVHFPALVREGEIADLTAVLANNQSFGKSRIGYLDYAMNIFRAVEIRRPLLRAANTGPSAIIQASGETGALTAAFKPESRAAVVYAAEEDTVYRKYGDWLLYLLYCVFIGETLRLIKKLTTDKHG